MTENNMESGQQQAGDGGQPSAASSPAAGTPPSAVDLKALAEALRPVIAEEVKRKEQSVKDKRIAKLQAGQEELLAKYDEFIQGGLTPARARRELMIEQMLESRFGEDDDTAPTAKVEGNHPQAASDYLAAVLKPLGLNVEDAEVLRIVSDTDDPLQQVTKVAELAQRRREAQARPANPAQVLSGGGGASVSADTLDSLTSELEELMKNPTQNQAKIREVSAKQRAMLPRQ